MKSKESVERNTDPREIFGRALFLSTPPIIGDCFRDIVVQCGWLAFISQEEPSAKEPTEKQKK